MGWVVTVSYTHLDVYKRQLLKSIVDRGVLGGDSGLVVRLSLVVAVVAVAEAILTVAQRWCSSTIGEGLIYRLRTQVFDHVSNQPIAFFTLSLIHI